VAVIPMEKKDILWVRDMGKIHPTESSNLINLIINRLLPVSFKTNKTKRKEKS